MATNARSGGVAFRRSALAGLLAAVLLALAMPASAQQATGADVVIAEVDGLKIYRSEFDDEVGRLPPQYRNLPMPFLYPALLDRLIDRKLLAAEARRRGLTHDPDFQLRMRRAEERALQEVFILRLIEDMDGDADLERYYRSQREGQDGPAVLTLRQIVVHGEIRAYEIVRELERGAVFADLARRFSIDETAGRDGLIGEVRRGDLSPVLEAAAFGLDVGQFTTTPVKSPAGWHVIYLEQRSYPEQSGGPEGAENPARQRFQAERAAARIDNAVEALRRDAEITRYNHDGTPIAVPGSGGD